MTHASSQSTPAHWSEEVGRLSAIGDHLGAAELINGVRRRVDQVGAFDRQWQMIVQSADICGLPVEITKGEALKLFQIQDGRCALSGLPISIGQDDDRAVRGTSTDATFGRIDLSRGYVLGNVWWLHRDIGRVRSDLLLPRFLELCRLIADREAARATFGLWLGGAPEVTDRRTPVDAIAPFLHDCIKTDPTHRETSAALWQAFNDWCAINDAQPCTRTAFGRALRSHGYESRKGHVLTWGGLRLLPLKGSRVR